MASQTPSTNSDFLQMSSITESRVEQEVKLNDALKLTNHALEKYEASVRKYDDNVSTHQKLNESTRSAMTMCVSDLMKYSQVSQEFQDAWTRLRILSTLYAQLTEKNTVVLVDRPSNRGPRNKPQ